MSPRVRYLLGVFLFAAANLSLSIAGNRLDELFPESLPVWAVAGLEVGALLMFGLRMWPGVFLAGLLSGVIEFGMTGPQSLVFALCVTGQAVGIAWTLHHIIGLRRDFERIQDVLGFAAVCVPIAAFFSGAGILLLHLFGHADALSLTHWLDWWLGNTAALLIVTPLLLVLRRRAIVRWSARRAEAAALFCAVAVSCWVGFRWIDQFAGVGDFPIVPVPLLMWAAIRFRTVGAAVGNLMLCSCVLVAGAQGSGPLATADGVASILVGFGFIAMVWVSTMTLAAALNERHRAETVAKNHREALRAVADNVPGVLFCLREKQDGERSVSYVSPGVHELLGAAAAKRIDDDLQAIPELLGDEAMPSRSGSLEPEEGVRQPFDRVCEVAIAPGVRRWIRSIARPLARPEGDVLWNGILLDVTEARQNEESLREVLDRYHLALRVTNDVIFEFDCDSQELVVDQKRFRDLTHWSDAELQRPCRSWLSRAHPEDRARLRALPDQCDQSESAIDLEYRARTRDDEYRWFRIRGQATLDCTGRLQRLVGALNDISDKVRADDERCELVNQLHHSHKMEAVGQLAGGIAHDFNNLLTGIMGNAELLADRIEHSPETCSSEATRDKLSEILCAGRQAGTLTRKLLTFSRKQLPTLEVFDPNRIVSELEGMLGRLINQRIELRTELGADAGCLRADTGQIEQIVINLAVNARDAMPDGGTLTIRTQRVELDEGYVRNRVNARSGPHLLLQVTDTGTGMDEHTLNHAFEPFFSTKPKDRGTGLGLSTVYGIVAQLGGHIDVGSIVGRGTRFSIYLPRVESEALIIKPSIEDGGAIDLRGDERVLVCEDNGYVRRLTAQILEDHGYQVLVAEHGWHGIKVLEESDAPIDLLVTDVIMPEMNGPDLARRLREERRDLPVLFMSGYTADALSVDANRRDDTDFLQKPFRAAALLKKIRALLDTAASSPPIDESEPCLSTSPEDRHPADAEPVPSVGVET